MKVLLRSDIAGVGRRGDIITVSSGHARNHLLPHGLAIVASDGEVVQAGVMRRARDLRENTEREAARGVAANLVKQSIKVKAKAGAEGRLFGSISSSEIAAALLDQTGITVDRKDISIASPIRSLGEHQVSVALYGDVAGVINLTVIAK
ncbi:MAG: 50S ribosomal protein L9 [Actinobacteria bacterium]|nr:MAG: 50S ribosomal protein L9 [Actinomycetota bacterium]